MAGMRQIFPWRSTNNVSTGTVYNSLTGGRDWTSTLAQATTPWCVTGRFKNLRVRLASAPGSAKYVQFTVMINGSDTRLNCRVDGTNTEAYCAGAVSISDGDTVVLKAVGSGTPTVSVSEVSVDFISDSDYQSGYAHAPVGASGTGGNRWTPLFFGINGWSFVGECWNLNAVEGDITKMAIIVGTAPGVGNTITYCIDKDGVAQDGTGGTPDTRVTISGTATTGSATFSLSVSPGNTLALKQHGGTGSPASPEVRVATRLVADTNGEFLLGASLGGTVSSSSSTVYNAPVGSIYANWNATESNVVTRSSPYAAVQIKAMYLDAGNVLSGNGVTFKLRVNGADTALAITAMTAGTGNVTSTVDVPALQNLTLSAVGLGGGGFSRSIRVALRGYVNPTESSRLTPSVVQEGNVDTSQPNGAASFTFGSALTVGNHVVLFFSRYSHSGGYLLDGQAYDDKSNLYGLVHQHNGGGGSVGVCIAKITTGGTTQVTWDPTNGSEYHAVYGVEMTDVDPHDPIFDNNQADVSTDVDIDLRDLTAACHLFGVATGNAGSTVGGAGTGFSEAHRYNYGNSVLQGILVIEKAASAGSEDVKFTFTGASRAVGFAVQGEFGTADINGEFDVTTPVLTASFSGEIPMVGEFDAVLPKVSGTFLGYDGDPSDGFWAGSLQPLLAEFHGGVPIEAEFDVTTNVVRGLFYGGQAIDGEFAGVIPLLQGLFIGGVPNTGSFSGTLQPVQGFFLTDEINAEFAGTLPVLTGSFVGYGGGGTEAIFSGRMPKMRARFIGDVPVDQLTLLINGVDRGDNWYMPGGWNVRKDGEKERMNFYLADPRYSVDAVSADTNDVVLLKHPVGGLIFGGLIADTEKGRIKSEAGTLTQITANDWMFLADQVFVPRQRFLSQDAYVLFNTLIERYMSAKGIVNIGPPTGGPILPDLTVDTPVTSVRKLWDRMREEAVQPIRINGELEAAMVEPGSLIWPGGEVNGSIAKLLPDLKVRKEINTSGSANRLWVETIEPPMGPGPYWHYEDTIADGIKTVFMTNVIPSKVYGKLAAEANATATSLQLKELPPNSPIRYADKFFLTGDPREYMVTADTMTNDNGEATISCEVLELDATEGTEIAFDPPAFMKLFVGGIETPFAGAPWVWEPIECAFVNPAAAPAAGLRIRKGMWIKHPVHIRVWETAPVIPMLPIGWFDYSVLVDGFVEDQEYWDMPYAAERLRFKLQEPTLGKQVIQFETHEHGIYPFIMFPVSFPNSGVTGNFFAETVDISPTGADKRLTQKDLRYVVTARKDVIGRAAWDWYRKKVDIKWGVGELTIPTDFQWSANREFVEPFGGQDGLVFNPTPDWEWTDFQDVISVTGDDLVITAVVVEFTDAAQPYFSWSRGFEIQLAVTGAGLDPTPLDVIAKLKGHSKDPYYAAEASVMRLTIPVDACPEGSRLSMRVRKSPGGWLSTDGPWNLSVQYYKKPLTGNLQTTPYVHEHTAEGEVFTELTQAGVANTWSDWVELLDLTPYDLYLTAFIFSPYSFSSFVAGQIQFGIADTGDEPTDEGVIADISTTGITTMLGSTNYFPFENPLFVNSDQRIMVRVRSNYAGTDGIGFALHYVRAEE